MNSDCGPSARGSDRNSFLNGPGCFAHSIEPYFLVNGVLLPRERLSATRWIELSIGEDLAMDRFFNCFGFFASRLLRF